MFNYINKLKHNKVLKPLFKEDGLSLIEAAIGVVLLGVISVPFFQALRIDQMQDTYKKTNGSLSDLKNSLNQYNVVDGSYPCPASLIAQEGDVDFGIAKNFGQPTCQLSDITLCSTPTWATTDGGVCKTSDIAANAVIIGSLPFASTKIQRQRSLDSWGHKILYAVSYLQTDPATYVIGAGVVNVLVPDDPADALEDGVPEPHSELYDFILVSHGESARGAYNKDGVLGDLCPLLANGLESHNCDMDNQFLLQIDPNNLRASTMSRVEGLSFYDDLTLGQSGVPADTWFQHPDNTTYVDQDYLLTISNRIGVGIIQPLETIHVAGAIRVEDSANPLETLGNVKTATLCNLDETGCFDPEVITGTKEQMRCDPFGNVLGDQVVTEIRSSHVVCSTSHNIAGLPIASSVDASGNPYAPSAGFPLDSSLFTSFTCPVGQLAIGVDAAGVVQCLLIP